MITRLHFFGERLQSAPKKSSSSGRRAVNQRGYTSGWLILSTLTLLFLFWLVFTWLNPPTWLATLPSLLFEFLQLIEMATAITLLLLWAGLLWRNYQHRTGARKQHLDIDEIYGLSPGDFEHYVADLFRQKGYRVIVRGGSGDHGVDLELFGENNRRAVVQCKRYRDTVGEKVVRDLYGTLLHERASHAFLVTTADVSDAARKWAKGKPITIIDGSTLVDIASVLFH